MTKNNLHHDTALRQVMQQRAEAAERMTLADDFTDRLMERIEQHDKQPQHRRLWLYPAIGIAAAIALLFSIGVHINDRDGDAPSIVAQADTMMVAPPTETKKVEERPLQKEEGTEKADSANKVKEILQMSRPPKHYMAKRETQAETIEEPAVDENCLAEWTIAEEEQRLAMEMMLQTSGSLQDDYLQMTREIRERGNRMTQQVETALSDDTY
ncbi:MAG: hypothetical protein IKI19_03705 [Prevotella sp.]|nr:hypothetical protein [Prevotella sp.]